MFCSIECWAQFWKSSYNTVLSKVSMAWRNLVLEWLRNGRMFPTFAKSMSAWYKITMAFVRCWWKQFWVEKFFFEGLIHLGRFAVIGRFWGRIWFIVHICIPVFLLFSVWHGFLNLLLICPKMKLLRIRILFWTQKYFQWPISCKLEV